MGSSRLRAGVSEAARFTAMMTRPLQRLGGSAVALSIATVVSPPAAVAQTASRPALVAVFAHPDDEIAVGPLLARYAREGADVRVVFATNGEKGTRITAIPAGDALGRARALEAACSAQRLGIKPPILLNLGDGVLAVPANLRRLEAETARVLKELQPRSVVTWGAEGLDGHPDHRIVGAVVTEIVQGWTGGEPPPLYYPGFPPDRTAAVPDSPFARTPTLDRFLTVRIPFEPRDVDAAQSAFDCHESQYTREERDRSRPRMNQLRNGHIYLRPAFAHEARRSDLFR